MVNEDDAEGRSARAVIARFAPQLAVVDLGVVGEVPAPSSHSIRFVTQVTAGCTEAQTLARYLTPEGPGCARPVGHMLIHVGGLDSLPVDFSLSSSQRPVLEAGGILVADPKTVQHGKVSYVSGTVPRAADGARGASGTSGGRSAKLTVSPAETTHRAQLPAVVVDSRAWTKAFKEGTSAAWILPRTAKQHGWPLRVNSLQLSSPTGTISAQEERILADRLGDGSRFEVERGYRNTSRSLLLILISVVGLLVLIASLISTALSLAEGQNDMATLAAVGATRHTRRGIAGSQAVVVAACGCVLGLLVGLVPGIAISWPLTTQGIDLETHQALAQAPTIVVPWLPLVAVWVVAVCVGLPLLAGRSRGWPSVAIPR